MAYLNVDEIEAAIQSLAAAYPSISEVVVLPHLTHEGRQTRALRVGALDSASADGLLVLGGVHAREWMPPDALVSLAADLLEAYDLGTGLGYVGKSFSAAQVARLMENVNLYLFPCVNPDGRSHSQYNDSTWRKNRRPQPAGGGGGSCVGVDLNRNFDFLWDHEMKFAPDSGVRTSSDPCHYDIYRGPSAASEPETKNVVWILDQYPRIRWHIDVHSAVPVILQSWGSDENQSDEPTQNFLNASFDAVRGRPGDAAYGEFIQSNDASIARTLGTRMNDAIAAVRGVNYGVEQAYGLYPTSGASDDYAYSRAFEDPSKTKVYGFTVECGTSFQPAFSEAENVIREVSAGLIAFALDARALTEPLRVELETASLVFADVPELETTARAVVWHCFGLESLTFEVVSGPSGPFSALLGTSVTIPAPGVTTGERARLWCSYGGTTAGAMASGSVTVRCVQTGEEWVVPISANTIARPTAAVLMVLDQSGSMDFDAGDGRRRVEVLQEAAQNFVDVLQPETGVGVVRFDHDAYGAMAIQDAGPEIFGPGRAAAAAAVASHAPNPLGATSIGDGVEMAGGMLDGVAASHDVTAMVVLTDGQENASKFISDVAGSIDDRVYAIGLGTPETVDPDKLTDLTNGSGGYVVMTGALSQDEYFILSKYYLQILAGATNEEVVLDPSGYLQPTRRTAIPFSITEADAGSDVILLCPAPSAMRMTLEAPTGLTIAPSSGAPGVTFAAGRGVAYYRLTLPVVGPAGDAAWAGRWVAHLECDRVAFSKYLNSIEDDPKAYAHAQAHGLRYAVEVHSRSSLRMTTSLTRKENAPGTPLRITARLSEYGMPVERRARVVAQITSSGGSQTVRLDEGAPGTFEAETTAQVEGTYRVRIVGEGKTLRGSRFTREQTRTASIYTPRPPEDPKPPPDRPDELCAKVFVALLRVLERDRRLAGAVERALRLERVDLQQLLLCLKKAGGRSTERPPGDTGPGVGGPPA